MGGRMDRRAMLAGMGALSLNGIVAKALAETAVDADNNNIPPRPDMAAYVRSPKIEDVSLSPDGKRIALITKSNGDYYAISYDIATEATQPFQLGNHKVRGVFWGSNDHIIVSTSTTIGLREYAGSKQEHFLAHNINVTTRKLHTLFSRMDNFYNTVVGDLFRIKVDGKYYATASNYYMVGESPLCLYRFDLDTNRGKQIDQGYNDTRDWVITPSGIPVARSDFDRDSKEWRLEFYKKGSGWKKVYTQKEAIDYPSLIGLGRGEDKVIVYIDAGENAGGYFEVSADGTFSEPLDKNGYDRSPRFHPTTRQFAGFARWDDWVTYEYHDPKMQKLADLCKGAMPGYNVSIYEFAAEDPRKVLIYGESSDDPGTYYFIDFGAGKSLPIGENYPDLPAEWITQKKPIKYKAADGLEIHGYLTLPPSKVHKNLPLIVLPHGGPQARDTSSFDWESQLYASRGYAVLQPNYRGSSGYGDAFVEAGYGQFGRKMQTDLSDGVRYLAKDGTIDPKRVAIVGASYGGYAALAGATFDPDVYNCAVSVAGLSDLKEFVDYKVTQTASARSSAVLYWKRFLGDKDDMNAVSPARHAANCKIPVLLIHGKDDVVVPIDQSRRMERALKNAGKDVTFIELKGEDHWQSVEAKRVEMSTAILGFIEKHNPVT
ncbi:alpha/beta hydrolase family protein [Asticcacaulis endophyticus]|uniref:Prolyl oligopeptidase n=1 Tax=Asticcacaulis endophyticus TaxID=1395890 RepID=A0A918Q327_9CAUL|nr:S9 family peptidase [Asticcacaulis endophyticus]GGZ30143.1 prolyl oligopeptidase [Asticcacaulis endophyticus]